MTDTIVWTIAIAFFAPFHYLEPLLVSFLSGSETPPQRKRLIISILIGICIILCSIGSCY